MIDETGHLVTHSSDGEVLFWDYPREKVVKVSYNVISENKGKKGENYLLLLRRLN